MMSLPLIRPQFTSLIEVNEQQLLTVLCERWLKAPFLAIDTEFMRVDTFYPIAALIQVCDGESVYLIDPVAIADSRAFNAVLQNDQVIKFLHSSSEDIEVFKVLYQQVPKGIWDTQLAAALLGYGYSVGYGNLINKLFDVQIAKDETRSNWLQRPLTQNQKVYAALDVEYLWAMGHFLWQKAEQLNRNDWIKQESDFNLEGEAEPLLTSAAQKFRSAWRLNGRSLAALEQLLIWRDATAQSTNKVRNHIVADRFLYELVELMPRHISQLRTIKELPERSIRVYGEAIITIIEAVFALPDQQWPERLPRPLNASEQELLNEMRAAVVALSVQLALAPEVLARRRDYEYIVRAKMQGKTGEDCLPDSFKNWRWDLLKPCLQAWI